jgi:hypothetical protein
VGATGTSRRPRIGVVPRLVLRARRSHLRDRGRIAGRGHQGGTRRAQPVHAPPGPHRDDHQRARRDRARADPPWTRLGPPVASRADGCPLRAGRGRRARLDRDRHAAHALEGRAHAVGQARTPAARPAVPTGAPRAHLHRGLPLADDGPRGSEGRWLPRAARGVHPRSEETAARDGPVGPRGRSRAERHRRGRLPAHARGRYAPRSTARSASRSSST